MAVWLTVPRRCYLSEIFAHCLDDPATPDPQPQGDADSSVEKDPYGGESLCRHRTGGANEPQTHQRTNCIAAAQPNHDGDIIVVTLLW